MNEPLVEYQAIFLLPLEDYQPKDHHYKSIFGFGSWGYSIDEARRTRMSRQDTILPQDQLRFFLWIDKKPMWEVFPGAEDA